MGNILDDEIEVEGQLTEEISNLWTEHVRVAGQKKSTAAELRLLRSKLAERLFEMKKLLCQPGRAGEWRGWLSTTVKIPRSTADRLVERHAEMSGATTRNVPSEAIPPEQQVEALVKSTLPRLRKVLTSPQMAYQFMCAVSEELGLTCTTTEHGVLLAKPVGGL